MPPTALLSEFGRGGVCGCIVSVHEALGVPKGEDYYFDYLHGTKGADQGCSLCKVCQKSVVRVTWGWSRDGG